MNCAFWIICFGFSSAVSLCSSAQDSVSSVDDLMVAALGDSINLPCAVSSRSDCSSVTWTKEDNPKESIASEGRAMASNANFLRDCSLQINNVANDNATTYVCNNGKNSSSVHLRIVNITEKILAEKDKIELHCFLNSYTGNMVSYHCENQRVLISWLAEDNTVITNNTKRFLIMSAHNCLVKLLIEPTKPTDHHRKLRCQVSVSGSPKATVSYTTAVADGVEERFAAVDDSVSLACTNTSSLGLTSKNHAAASVSFTDSSIIVSKVSSAHARDYPCMSAGQRYSIRLHTIDITSKLDSERKKITLTCVLTCANDMCDKDFNLTWSKGYSAYNTLLSIIYLNGSLMNSVTVPLEQLDPGKTVCSVLREGVQVASKQWHQNDVSTALPGLAWIAVPLALLCAVAIVTVCVYRRKKHSSDTEHLQANVEMTHVYEDVEGYEPRGKTAATVTSNDSFYDLLQAVN